LVRLSDLNQLRDMCDKLEWHFTVEMGIPTLDGLGVDGEGCSIGQRFLQDAIYHVKCPP
jgi:hypothetical protein